MQVKNRHYEWFYKFFPAIAVHERLENTDVNTSPKDVLIYENGKYKAVFWIITDKNGYPSNLLSSMSVLFKKPEK